LKRSSETVETPKTNTCNVMLPCCLGGWILIIVELDAGVEIGGGAWSSQRRGARRCGSGAGNLLAGRRQASIVERSPAQWARRKRNVSSFFKWRSRATMFTQHYGIKYDKSIMLVCPFGQTHTHWADNSYGMGR
jgi:hypothetical protein